MNVLLITFISSVVLVSLSAVPLTQQATSPPSIVRKPLLDAQLASDKSVHHVQIVSIDFEPSQKTGAHVHPIPVIGYVVKGTIVFQIDGEPQRTLAAGEPFFEPAGARIVRFDNASNREPASFIANYLLGPTDRELIQMLPPVQ